MLKVSNVWYLLNRSVCYKDDNADKKKERKKVKGRGGVKRCLYNVGCVSYAFDDTGCLIFV